MKSNKIVEIAGLIVIGLIAIFIVNPKGNFPLNDDWAYALSVKHWNDSSEFKLFNWGEMTLVAHIVWGIIFTSFQDFSFTVLRWSTLILSIAGAIGLYLLLIEVKFKNQLALFAALLLFFNPIYFSLSFSFMTDIPFTTSSIFASLFLIRYHKTQSLKHLILSVLFLVWALLIKQLVLVLPLAYMLSELIYLKRFKLKSTLPFFILLSLYLCFNAIMSYFKLLPDHYNNKLGFIIDSLFNFEVKFIRNIPGYTITILAYIGFLLLPFFMPLIKQQQTAKTKLIYHLTSLGLTMTLLFFDKLIPSLDNVWVDFGIGPTTLFDHYGNFKVSPHFSSPLLLKLGITYFGVYAALYFSQYITTLVKKEIRGKSMTFESLFALINVLIYCAPFVLVGIYDRYIIWLIPFIFILLRHKTEWLNSKLGVTLILSFIGLVASFSIAATHDYLSWNRQRWKTINELIDNGVSTREIQGGVEFSTWMHFDEHDPKWYENQTDEKYVLTFKALNGFETLDTIYYEKWLPGENTIFLNSNP